MTEKQVKKSTEQIPEKDLNQPYLTPAFFTGIAGLFGGYGFGRSKKN